MCAEVDGTVANVDLFEQYDIPLPTNYAEFVDAIDAFEAVGIKGYGADWAYDYTCLETMQGCAIPELMSLEGTAWRMNYESESPDERTGLDDVVWPTVFEKYEQFLKDGYVRVDRHEGDNYGYTAFKEYIEDPEANPRPTPSGKLEIYCQSLSNWVDAVGFDTKSPIAEYQVPQEGYEETLADWETKEKGEYPFQLVTLHCLRTVHSSFDNVPQIREAGPNNLQMNARDAAELGIQNGDTVLITSKWGKCLRNVDATERIMPGVLKLDEATWPEIDEETGIDHAGACNYLIGDLRSGSGIQAWNSCICKVEKWDGESLPADCLWPQRVIDVEKEA